jgi:hypothetical protein
VLHAHGENQEKLVVLELRDGAMPVLGGCHLGAPASLDRFWEALGISHHDGPPVGATDIRTYRFWRRLRHGPADSLDAPQWRGQPASGPPG